MGAHRLRVAGSVLIFAMTAATALPVLSATTGTPPEFVLAWGSPGTGDGQFTWPVGLGIGLDGSVVVTDSYGLFDDPIP